MTTVQNTQQNDPNKTTGNYVHKNADGTFTSYRNGWAQYYEKPTYEEAAAGLFDGFSHGYSLSYYPCDDEGGDIWYAVCADCARDMWLENPEQQFLSALNDGDGKYERDEYCENCNTIIEPQACPECGDPIAEKNNGLPLFAADYHVCHAHCIASAVTKGEAIKTGKLTYTVDRDATWYGGVYSAA